MYCWFSGIEALVKVLFLTLFPQLYYHKVAWFVLLIQSLVRLLMNFLSYRSNLCETVWLCMIFIKKILLIICSIRNRESVMQKLKVANQSGDNFDDTI